MTFRKHIAQIIPVLRPGREKEQGPHRSATPERTHMKAIPMNEHPQGLLHFIREGFVTFTPAQAGLVLRECRYERQRDESRAKAHINAMAEQMKRGLWLPKTQIDFARVGSRLILVNGHHRMHAQLVASANVLWNVVIHECANDDEVAALYWKFDTTLRKRSNANILQGIGFAGRVGLANTEAGALWRSAPIIAYGLRFYRYQNDSKNLLPDERQAVAEEYQAEARQAQAFFKLAPARVRQLLRAPGRFAVILVTLKHCPSQAQDFWRGVCEDDGLTKGDPRKAMLIDLQSRNGSKGLQAQHMMAAARCWNAWHAGIQLHNVKVTGKDVVVAGTPYTVRA